MTRDKLIKKCLPESVCITPVGKNANEITPEEFENCFTAFFDDIMEIGRADISGLQGYGELDRQNEPSYSTFTDYLTGTFDDQQKGYWYHWRELFDERLMPEQFFDRYYQKMLDYSSFCEGRRYLVNNNTFFVNMIVTDKGIGFPDWSRAGVTDFLLDFAIMDLNKPYLLIPEKLVNYAKERNIEIPEFRERFLCMAYYKGIDTLRWHASINDEISCKSIMKSLSELEERLSRI